MADRRLTYPEVVARANDKVMTHHHAVHVAGGWVCCHCGRELGPFGAGMPVTVADCTPRRWADGAP